MRATLRSNKIREHLLSAIACLSLFILISEIGWFVGYSYCKPVNVSAVSEIQSNEQRPANCEDILLYLDQAVSKYRKTKDNSYLIVIGRLGVQEKGSDLNQARLKAVKQYLKRFSDLKYVTAEGERTKNLGQIEIYVSGRLVQVIHLMKNVKYFCKEPIG